MQYFFTGRYLQTTEGIENPLPTLNAIHDFSQQEKGFAYMSTFVDPVTRLSLIAGTATSWFQIPNVPGQPVGLNGNPPVTSAFGVTNFNSAQLNENQYEDTQFGVLALQRSVNGFDGQLSYFTRYNFLHFMPDPVGDLLLNGIASDITRESFTNGIQGDASYIINAAHTLRAGFTVSGEQTAVGNQSLVEPCTICDGTDQRTARDDHRQRLESSAGSPASMPRTSGSSPTSSTLNYGLRFDQMWQYVDANQFSPRVSFTYKPFEFTTFHAGYARYFTPPVLVEAAPANIALVQRHDAAHRPAAGPIRCCRSGRIISMPASIRKYRSAASRRPRPTAACSISASTPITRSRRDLIDNGNFGQALVLSAFNYAKGISEGVEFSAKYHSGNFQAYGNLAVGQEKATDVVSNQYLFDNATPLADLGGLTELQYMQTRTGSIPITTRS